MQRGTAWTFALDAAEEYVDCGVRGGAPLHSIFMATATPPPDSLEATKWAFCDVLVKTAGGIGDKRSDADDVSVLAIWCHRHDGPDTSFDVLVDDTVGRS